MNQVMIEVPTPQLASLPLYPNIKEIKDREMNSSICLATPPQVFVHCQRQPIIPQIQSRPTIIVRKLQPTKDPPHWQTSFGRSRNPTKKRVTITQQLLERINSALKYYDSLEGAQQRRMSLKMIAEKLNLGYRTILNKYKEFKSKKEVTGGRRLAKGGQIYKKTSSIISIVTKSVNQRRFKTTQELCNFIRQRYQISFKRTTVWRYYSKLKFKNALEDEFARNTVEEKQLSIQALRFYKDITEQHWEFLYFSEEIYQMENGHAVSVMVLCGSSGFLYKSTSHQLQDRHELLFEMIASYLQKARIHRDWVLVSDISSIYEGFAQHPKTNRASISVSEIIVRLQGKMFCLPLGCQSFNPATLYVQILREGEHYRGLKWQAIVDQLQFYRKSFFSTFPLLQSHIRQQMVSRLLS